MRRAILIAAVVATSNILILLPLPAIADPILISAGGVGFDTGDPPGLRLNGDAFSLTSLFPHIASPIACAPSACVAGTSVSLSTVFAPYLGFGFSVIGENSYGTSFAAGSRVEFRGRLSFDAATLPIPNGEIPGGGNFQRLTSPFVLTGNIAAFSEFNATVPLFEAEVAGQYAYVGPSFLTFDRGKINAMGDYGVTRVSARLATRRWRVEAYVDNLTDARENTFAFVNPFSREVASQATPLRPRTVGASLGWGF